MRTPVVLVAGQGTTDDVATTLIQTPGTISVGYAIEGHVAIRQITEMRAQRRLISVWPIEVTGCLNCAIRADLLPLLRRLHRRADVARIAVQLPTWGDPESLCNAIEHTPLHLGPGYIDGPAARDVVVTAVVTGIDTGSWLADALGDDDLDDDRTVAQVVVGQAEFADVLVLTEPDAQTLAVLRRLTPRARITVGTDNVELALANLDSGARRGRSDDPHDPLLAGQPPLRPEGAVQLLEFNSRRPFHPLRLHHAIDELLDGVVRIRGRAWLASQPDAVVWIESAGAGLGVGHCGTWLADMEPGERAYVDPERIALAASIWDDRFGDRHIAMTALVCGADPDVITGALNRALLTDDELASPQDWPDYPDPFGDWHETADTDTSTEARNET
ncbi:GTP-binding protein [Mycolicibacterium sp. 120266]|uniref:ribosome hibernation factor-recruiting GTPase MRF n=1 Tax=Mycolicibacterium sp. 120266 TaxID=3090601 RepID=UPI00299E7328|nr:GTP-binding protein [Mycolicibacterium sp. 120266]MDX1871186.1 GTP-binding protein [Mycolicibacterium sp. 120266]